MTRDNSSLTRRLFLQRAGHLGALGAAAPMALSFAGCAEATSLKAGDYKALVCVFLYGGNDYANTVIPVDLPNYDAYAKIRGGTRRGGGGIAYPHEALAATALTPAGGPALTDDIQYALNPNMPNLAGLFNRGRAAVQLNVGPLITPLTRAQYESNNRDLYPLPPKLFSHNDQQSVWQALGSEGATVGWGGRLGDLIMDGNDEALLTCVSAAGNAVFVSGNEAMQYQISPEGAIPVNAIKRPYYGGPELGAAIDRLITAKSGHMLQDEFTRVTRRSMRMEEIVNTALGDIRLDTKFNTRGGEDNQLAGQMKIIARLIGAGKALGAKRQVFFASLGGFDNHDRLMENHPTLLAKVDEAVGAFYEATVEMGVANQVTTFTASDFGRTLAMNADGSDHGWGGHHFVVGGAVNGGRYYGTAPHVSLETDDQVGQGRLLPSTGVDEYAATLARWFGASDHDLADIFPHIGNFSNTDLGFV